MCDHFKNDLLRAPRDFSRGFFVLKTLLKIKHLIIFINIYSNFLLIFCVFYLLIYSLFTFFVYIF